MHGQGFLFSYVDDALLVSQHQVSEEAGLGHLPQVDHVVHTLGHCRVHDPEGGLQLLGQTVLLQGVGGGQTGFQNLPDIPQGHPDFALRPCLPSPHRPPVNAGQMV